MGISSSQVTMEEEASSHLQPPKHVANNLGSNTYTSKHSARDKANHSMRPSSRSKTTTKRKKRKDTVTPHSSRELTADEDTPMVDAPRMSSFISSTDRNPVEFETETAPTPSRSPRKRRLSTKSRPTYEQDTTPPAPSKRMRTVTDALGLGASQSSSQNQETLGHSPISSQNDLSSSTGSQQEPGGFSTKSAASTQPVANGTSTTTPERPSGGFFTEEEALAMENFKAEFCSSHSISPDVFNEFIQRRARGRVRFFLPQGSIRKQRFWDYIYAVLPKRKRTPIVRFMRRHFPSTDQNSQKWTTEQENELAALFDKMGPRWVDIAKRLGRTPDDVTQRWKNRVEHRATQKEGLWSSEECEELEEALEKCRTLLREEGKDVGSDLYSLDEALIGWGRISDMIGNKRTRQQCADKWRRIRRKVFKNRSDQDANAKSRRSGNGPTPKARPMTSQPTRKPIAGPSKPIREPIGLSARPIPKPATQQAKLSSLWGRGREVAAGGETTSDFMRESESEENLLGETSQGSVVNDNSSEDDSEEDSDEEGSVVPSTPSSTRSFGRHPGVGSPILGSLQDEDRDLDMIIDDGGSAPIATTANNDDYRRSEEVGSIGKDESPEIAESPAPRSEKEEETESGEDSDDTRSSVFATAKSVEVPRLASPLLGEFDSESESGAGSSNSGSESENESVEDEPIASRLIETPGQSTKAPPNTRDSKVESTELNNDLAVDRHVRPGSESDGSGNEAERDDDSDRESEKDNNIQAIGKDMPSVGKLERTGVEPPPSSDPQSSRDRTDAQTPSTPGRESLSNLRRSYRVRQRAVREEHPPKPNLPVKPLKKGGSFEGESSSPESSSSSDSDSDDHRESSLKMKPATHNLNHVTSLPAKNALSDDWRRNRSPPQSKVLKENGKSNSTLKSLPLQKGSRNVPKNENSNRTSGLPQYLESVQINGISEQNQNSYDSSTDSETGDIPFSYE